MDFQHLDWSDLELNYSAILKRNTKSRKSFRIRWIWKNLCMKANKISFLFGVWWLLSKMTIPTDENNLQINIRWSIKSLFHYLTNSHAKLLRVAHIKPSTLNFAARLSAPKQSLLSAVSESWGHWTEPFSRNSERTISRFSLPFFHQTIWHLCSWHHSALWKQSSDYQPHRLRLVSSMKIPETAPLIFTVTK